jgi:hypothetical protein
MPGSARTAAPATGSRSPEQYAGSQHTDHRITVRTERIRERIKYFQQQATYGTGGGDTVTFDASGDWYAGDDIILLRFDREAQ